MRLVSDNTVLSGSLSGHTARVSELLLLPAQSPARKAPLASAVITRRTGGSSTE